MQATRSGERPWLSATPGSAFAATSALVTATLPRAQLTCSAVSRSGPHRTLRSAPLAIIRAAHDRLSYMTANMSGVGSIGGCARWVPAFSRRSRRSASPSLQAAASRRMGFRVSLVAGWHRLRQPGVTNRSARVFSIGSDSNFAMGAMAFGATADCCTQ
eukprot:5807935-Prymnesium_polylepis.2